MRTRDAVRSLVAPLMASTLISAAATAVMRGLTAKAEQAAINRLEAISTGYAQQAAVPTLGGSIYSQVSATEIAAAAERLLDLAPLPEDLLDAPYAAPGTPESATHAITGAVRVFTDEAEALRRAGQESLSIAMMHAVGDLMMSLENISLTLGWIDPE